MNPSYDDLLAENAVLKSTVSRLEIVIKKLEERITDLEARLNQNSKNSSKPSSTDKKPNRREKSKDEKRPYHPGANRQLLPANAVTSQETRLIETCPRCRSIMQPTKDIFSWQQIELPVIKPLVHQINLVLCKCSNCHLKARPELNVGEQFLLGPRLEGFVNLLLGQYRQGHRPVRTIISTILPEVILSQGLISKIKARTAALLSAPYEALLSMVTSTQKPLHVDATGWRHAGSNEHILVLRVENIVSYAFISHQNGETLGKLMGNKIHCLISDRGLATAQIEVRIKQYCLAHLIRNIRGQAEHPGVSCEDTQRLGVVYDTLQELFIDKHRAEKGEIGESTWKQYGYAKWRGIQEELEGLIENSGSKKLRKFCCKLLKQFDFFRAYLKDATIPMTNNPAEESLRNLVIARKLCFGSQSVYGKKWRETLHSCIETLHRQGRSILDFLAEAIRAARVGEPTPSFI